jgi:hypothetical protein
MAATAPSAWADQIEVDLSKKGVADKVVSHLGKRKFDNVGVLSFTITWDNGPAVRVGRLNGLMATRLENVLIKELRWRLTKDRPGIVLGAGNLAAEKIPDATYKTPEGRARLFELKYRRGWGETEFVKVDAFLTGHINFTKDMAGAHVIIQVFEKETPADVKTIAEFDTDTTANTLADLGVGFVTRGPDDVPAANDKSKIKGFKLSTALLNAQLRPEPPPTDKVNQLKPTKDETFAEIAKIVRLQIYYGDMLQGELGDTLTPPSEGQEVYFKVANKTAKRIGMVLRVNGTNTVDSDSMLKPADKYARWVLAAKTGKEQDYGIYGCYKDRTEAKSGKTGAPNAVCAPFTAGQLASLGSRRELVVQHKLGTIQVDLFEEGDAPVQEYELSLSEPAQRSLDFKDLCKNVDANAARAVDLAPTANRSLFILPDEKNRKDVHLQSDRFIGRRIAFTEVRYAPSPTGPQGAPK